jgi:glycosyltransferase involved in cell wall biosynthesis
VLVKTQRFPQKFLDIRKVCARTFSSTIEAGSCTSTRSRAALKIGIDTLFEDPGRPSSAIDYLKNLVDCLPRAGPQHSYYVFVSPRNRNHFQPVGPNVRLVNCFASNENVPLRIAIQQSVLPIHSQRLGLDVLFSPGNVCPLWGSFRRVLKINTLHHYSVPELLGRTRSLYRQVAFARSAKRADHIIANTAATKEGICKWMRVPDDKISVVAEASYDFYRTTPRDETQRVRARYNICGEYVLFVSNLYAYKNVETLIRAFAKLDEGSLGDYQLVIAGRDYNSYQAQLETLATDLKLAARVHFLGFVPPEDLPALYSGARVFVYPSLMETFGKPLLEAMSCGVPVVASNTSSIPEVLGNAGILVDPRDVEEMCRSIRDAATNPSLRADLIERGLERARHFSWQASAQETLRVIEKTADLQP